MCDSTIDVVVKNRKLNSSCNTSVIYVGKTDMIPLVCWIGNPYCEEVDLFELEYIDIWQLPMW